MHMAFNRTPEELPEIDNIYLPRELQKQWGIIIGVLAVLCAAAALLILVALAWQRGTAPGRFLALCAICALVSGAGIFLFRVSKILLTGRGKQGGGYCSPRALRLTSCAFVVLALLVLALSLQPPRHLLLSLSSLLSLWCAASLWILASRRKNTEHDQRMDPTLASGSPPAEPGADLP